MGAFRCHVCDADAETAYRLTAFAVLRCSGCGILFRDPLPTPEEVEAMYEDRSYHDSGYFAGQLEAETAAGPEGPIYRDGLDWLERRRSQRGHGPGTLLDVGSGAGLFLALAAKRGWRAEGVEISRALAEASASAHGVPVHRGDLATVRPGHARYDAVTMWDLLEHVGDPRATLRRARELLEPEGHLLVFTINAASLFNRLAHLGHAATGGRLSRPLELLYDKRHNYYFTQRTLQTTLDASGFRVLERTRYRAHLGRWVSEPVPGWMLAASELVDLASAATGMHYRQLVFCRPA